jgi:hypothetical protein
VAVALWSRTRDVTPGGLSGAFERRELVVGTMLRGTLHVVSAREHPIYARTAEAAGAAWMGSAAQVRAPARAFADSAARSGEELAAWIEAAIARGELAFEPGELAHQRTYKWRPVLRALSAGPLVRVPAGGHWGGSRTPADYLAAPAAPESANIEASLDVVVGCHLRAFGPAAAEDIAGWLGMQVPPVRATLTRIESALVAYEDGAGRPLYDLAAAPRPDPNTPAPVRFLPKFDSALLAYAPAHRSRILPDEYREQVYVRANLQVLASFLVDGMVAGTWSVDEKRKKAVLSISAFGHLDPAARSAVTEEGELLVRFAYPDASDHHVVIGP